MSGQRERRVGILYVLFLAGTVDRLDTYSELLLSGCGRWGVAPVKEGPHGFAPGSS